MNNSQNISNYDAALGLIQVFDVLLNLSQVSNDTLLEELQKQNREYLEKLVGYNQSYAGLFQARMDYLESQLEKIVKQNEEIKEQNERILSAIKIMDLHYNTMGEELIQQNEEIKAQNKELYQMQEKIWGDINELLERSEGR